MKHPESPMALLLLGMLTHSNFDAFGNLDLFVVFAIGVTLVRLWMRERAKKI